MSKETKKLTDKNGHSTRSTPYPLTSKKEIKFPTFDICSICFKRHRWELTIQLPCQSGFFYHRNCLIDWIKDKASNCGDWNLLHIAAEENNIKQVQSLLDLERFDVNALNNVNKTALHYAVDNNNIELAKLLIEYGADVRMADSGPSLIYAAIHSSDVGMVKLLIEKGARVERRIGDGGNLLHVAVENNCYDMAELLIECGADINARDGYGSYSPFYTAAFEGHFHLAKLLFSPESIENVNGEDTFESLMEWLDKKKHVEFKEWLEESIKKIENI